jgi:hypothetical protein
LSFACCGGDVISIAEELANFKWHVKRETMKEDDTNRVNQKMNR